MNDPMAYSKNHLPECVDGNYWLNSCICNQLRACEQRIRDAIGHNIMTPDSWSESMMEAYQRGLDAAREAVAALPEYRMRDTCVAAIDALREEKP